MEEPRSKFNFVSTFAMLLFLFIMPIGSWYYLKQGENFRKQQIEELEPKGDFNLEKLASLTSSKTDSIHGELMLISVIGKSKPSPELKTHIDELETQFGDRPDFNVLQLFDSEEPAPLINPGKRKNIWTTSFPLENLGDIGINPPENISSPYWVLVDIHHRVRHYYNQTEKEKLVVHTAMILPLEKRAKIEVQRDDEK